MSLWSNISGDTLRGAAFIRHGAWRDRQASVDHHMHDELTSRLVGNGRVRLVCVAGGTACGANLAAGAVLCECMLARLRTLWRLLVVAGALALSGCATDEAARVPVRDDVLLHVRLVEHIDFRPGSTAFGLTRCANNVCVVELPPGVRLVVGVP